MGTQYARQAIKNARDVKTALQKSQTLQKLKAKYLNSGNSYQKMRITSEFEGEGTTFISMREQTNVLGKPLQRCNKPNDTKVTGWFRDGFCNTDKNDFGSHTICVLMTEDFLEFSKKMGNDLSTPLPQMNFEGLKAGDNWALCANRFEQAYKEGKAPKIYLNSTNIEALQHTKLEHLKEMALDLKKTVKRAVRKKVKKPVKKTVEEK